MTHLERVQRYFSAISARAELAPYFCEDAVLREFPNRLTPNGATSDLAGMNAARERGRKAVENERYEILDSVEQGARIALEVRWTATLLVPIGNIPAGGTMGAHFAVFIGFRDGKIATQHNYDCFDPF